MSTPQPAEALERLVAAAEAGGAAAADLSAVGEFLARGGVFPPAVLRRAGLLPRADAAAAPQGLRGRGEESGGSVGAAARRSPERRGGGALTVYSYWGAEYSLRRSDPLPEPTVSCCASEGCLATVSASGQVFCQGWNGRGGLGVGDCDPRKGFIAAHLPWPAVAVSVGLRSAVALRRGGAAVCSWGDEGPWLGRGGEGSVPAAVQGLPPGDPVVLLEVGPYSVITVTENDEAYGWGLNRFGELALPAVGEVRIPLRIAALSKRGLRRLAFGECFMAASFAVAETAAGELFAWGAPPGGARTQVPQPLLPRDGRLTFPLRSLAAGKGDGAAVADGAGQLWCLWKGQGLASAGLPAAERVVRVAVGSGLRNAHHETMVVALTAEGRLWESTAASPCRSITAIQPELPLWLLPCKSMTNEVPLITDPCAGKARLRLLGRIAVRVRLPSDPVRVILTRFAVRQEFITGPADDPFSWPTHPHAEAQ